MSVDGRRGSECVGWEVGGWGSECAGGGGVGGWESECAACVGWEAGGVSVQGVGGGGSECAGGGGGRVGEGMGGMQQVLAR